MSAVALLLTLYVARSSGVGTGIVLRRRDDVETDDSVLRSSPDKIRSRWVDDCGFVGSLMSVLLGSARTLEICVVERTADTLATVCCSAGASVNLSKAWDTFSSTCPVLSLFFESWWCFVFSAQSIVLRRLSSPETSLRRAYTGADSNLLAVTDDGLVAFLIESTELA